MGTSVSPRLDVVGSDGLLVRREAGGDLVSRLDGGGGGLGHQAGAYTRLHLSST
jgi:hypothetical protein